MLPGPPPMLGPVFHRDDAMLLKGFHFAADEGPVALIKRKDLAQLFVPAGLLVGFDPAPSQVGAPTPVQIAGQECHLGSDVAVPETVVELDAIEHLEATIGVHADRLAPQITMTVTDPMFLNAPLENGGEAVQLMVHE